MEKALECLGLRKELDILDRVFREGLNKKIIFE